jgi:ribonucleoside-diphosphate reductase beta chain
MLEEVLHSQVGADIIQVIRKEQPEFFTKELNQEVRQMVKEALKAEAKIIDWIFEEGELEFLSKASVLEYMYFRANKGLVMAGFPAIKDNLNQDLLKVSEWFEIQIKTTIHRDFFTGHNTNYTKNAISFSEEDLF